MTIGLLVTAFFLGLRHGVDWDHIAAIADISGTAENRRRGLWLSFLYAVGHALVVFALGTLAIVAGASIPASLDQWMARVVGVTLIWLGLWVLIELARHGREFRLRSRWMLVLDGTFAGFRRVVNRRGRRVISVEHEHPHSHSGTADGPDDIATSHGSHRHDHGADRLSPPTRSSGDPANLDVGALEPQETRAMVGAQQTSVLAKATRHSHSHRHALSLPDRADGAGTAVGVGMLHGVGIESPTQIAVIVGSTSVAGSAAGLSILAAWCLGLIVANSGLALVAGLGLLEARRNFTVYATVAVVVALGSIAMGLLYLFGVDILPAIDL